MKILDLTLPTPQQNLACDEALMHWCEEGREQAILRFWEPQHHFIVLGYSNKIQLEVNLPECRKTNVPILRRCSGGGAVLQGPGCLNYSLILTIPDSGPLKTIDGTYSLVMKRHEQALRPILGPEIRVQSPCDLALGTLKFSGNAQCRRHHTLLFHGTFLLHLNLRLMESLLRSPSRMPTYRQGRSHTKFLVNLHVPADVIKEAFQDSWHASTRLQDVPIETIDALVSSRYSVDQWNFKF